MGMTFAQKALARAAGKDYVDIGEIVMANVDVAMMDDILGPRIEIAAGLKNWALTSGTSPRSLS